MKHCFRLGAGNGSASRTDNRTGVMKETPQLKTCDNHRPNAVINTSLNILLAAFGCMSVGVTQQGIEPNIQPAQHIHQPMITGIDDDGGLGTDT